MKIDQENRSGLYDTLIRVLPDDKFAKPQFDPDSGESIDLPAAMKATLADPESFPPLSESVFTGDTIAIAIESNLPFPRELINALLDELSLANVELSDVVVVIHRNTADRLNIPSQLYDRPNPNEEGIEPAVIPVDFGFHSINFMVHDDHNQAGVAYLGANKDGDPIYVNRVLVESDVVLVIGFPKPGDVSSQNDAVYPDFSNDTIKDRFKIGKGSFLSRREEVELANDSLGAFFSIQVVVRPGDTICQIISGSRKQATEKAHIATNDLWRLDWSGDVGMVVATIESCSEEQSWDDFANAIITASQVGESDGPIVVWSDIGMNPDRNIRKALLSQFEHGINAKMTQAMQHVASIVHERSVFLRSRLSRSTVEELGIGFIESEDEVVRISQSFSSGLLMRDAHRCQLRDASVASSTEGDQ